MSQQYGNMQQRAPPGGYSVMSSHGSGGQQMSNDEQTMIWTQQQSYYVDSGINSGVTTHAAASIISGHSSGIMDEYGDAYTPGYTQEQVDGYNADYEATRSLRIRNAMFPETIDDGIDIPSTQFDFGQSTNVQRLTEPSQMLKTAVVNIINYQDDAELTLKAVPELIKLLGDADPVVSGQAANVIHCLSKREAAASALATSQPLIQAVIHLMNQSEDPEVTKHTVGTLYSMSRHPNGLLAIFQSGGIPALIRLLSSPVDSVVFYAITTLHNLIMHQPTAKDAVRRYEGVPKMVHLLKTKNIPKFLAIVVDCVYNLALNNQDTKTVILQNDGPRVLVKILSNNQYEKLLWTTARLLQALSICPQNKQAIVACGGLQALSLHLQHPSQRLVRTILLATRNLSDAALREENVEPLLRCLLQLIGSNDSVVVSCCVCVLSNITCNNVRNKALICRSGGVETLMRTLEMTQPNEIEIIEATLCTLRHVTMRHTDAETAQNAVRLYRTQDPKSNGLHLISAFVRLTPPIPLCWVKAAMGLIRNLCGTGANLSSFSEYGVVHNICDHLTRSYQTAQQAQRSNTPAPIIDGITCMDLMEAAVGALQLLAKDKMNRSYIRQKQTIPIFVGLMYYDHVNIQRVSTGALSELVIDQDCAQLVEQQGAVPQLTELLHSHNEGVAVYAASVLRAIGRNKPEEYQQHLGHELSASLARDDSTAYGQDGFGEMPPMQDDAFDLLYSGTYDPAMNFDQMHVNSPAPGVNYESMDTGGHMPSSGQQQQRGPPQGAAIHDWYDTDL